MDTPASRLKTARKSLRLTQKALGEKLGMKWYQIKDMETEKVAVSQVFARLFCLEYGVHDYWLLRGEGEMIPEKRDRVAEPSAEYRDEVTRKILAMLEGMDVEAKRDVLKYRSGEATRRGMPAGKKIEGGLI